MKNSLIFAKLLQLVTGISSLLGFASIEDIPIDATTKKTSFTAEQVEKLKAAFGDKYQDYIDAMDEEVKLQTSKSLDLKAIEDELAALVKEKQNLIDAQDEGGTATTDAKENLELLKANQAKTDAKIAEQEKMIKKLMGESVGDVPEAIIKGKQVMKQHSATHLFASGKEYDKFEGRAWNQRLRDGEVKATDFKDDAIIPLLNKDVNHFVMENPDALQSLFNDIVGLPADWSVRTGVVDAVADGYIIPAEVAQGRAKGWSPNQKVKILGEVRKIFRKKIDIEFSGYELQNIENTWIHKYNANDGSHPYKMSFVGFLLAEIMKQRMVDDRISQIVGIYANNGGGNDNPGLNVDSQDGLLYNFWKLREVDKKYIATDLGLPTEAGIVDYVNKLILSIPEIERSQQGLELGLSQAWLEAYRVRAGEMYQVHLSTDQGKGKYTLDYPKNYPNIKFQPIVDFAKTDFMYITQSKNIEVLEYKTEEKSRLTFKNGGADPRNTLVFGDYRQGIGVMFAGTKRAESDPKNFELQKVWSNSVPVFADDKYMPLYENGSTLVDFHYKNMKVDAKRTSNIEQIDEAPKGMIIKIVGNTSLVGTPKVKNNVNFDLASDFNLKSGGTLTLRVLDTGVCKEVKRTAGPEVAQSNDVNFDIATINANDGSVFRYNGGATATLTNILNGYEEKEITIYGSATAGVDFVVDDAAGIEVDSTATLSGATKFIKLVMLDGVWTEVDRLV